MMSLATGPADLSRTFPLLALLESAFPHVLTADLRK